MKYKIISIDNLFFQKPRVYIKFGSELYFRAHRHLRFLKRVSHAFFIFSRIFQPYRPAWWAPNGLIMTIARSFRSKPSLPWQR